MSHPTYKGVATFSGQPKSKKPIDSCCQECLDQILAQNVDHIAGPVNKDPLDFTSWVFISSQLKKCSTFLTLPASRKPKPKCMKNTRQPIMIRKLESMAELTSNFHSSLGQDPFWVMVLSIIQTENEVKQYLDTKTQLSYQKYWL